MSLPLVRLGPNMKFEQLVAALNQNFALLQNLDRTQTIKDESGTPRIMLGRLPDNSYGMIVSKPGVNVTQLFQG